ncbi:MAG: hypothetical protein JJE22_10800 [Bacteroidia bacterium]|nr:hypothetical protein [Bacteroidia bacterium]
MNEKLYSSTPAGYLILSNLKDTTYNIDVGFPQGKLPEQSFSITVDKKDHGYLIKNFAEKGWGLFDLQNSSVQISATPILSTNAKKENQNTSTFTNILSKAADDPSLKEKTIQPNVEEKKTEIIQKEETKEEEVKPSVTEEKTPSKEETKVLIEEKPILQQDEVKTPISENYKRSVVVKKSESSNVEGFGLVFIDNYKNGIKDTIRILIPTPKLLLNEVKEEAKDEKKFLDIMADTSEKSKTIISVITQDSSSVKKNCTDIASDSDFYLLRKSMATATSDNNMIVEADKYFKAKCFTTIQLKNLSTLFLNEEGKYKFFDAAYHYVSDAENFASLESELKDEYYVKRFKAMLR